MPNLVFETTQMNFLCFFVCFNPCFAMQI